MNRWQHIIQSYFIFSKAQRRGIYVAIFLIVVLMVTRYGYPYFFSTKTVAADSVFLKQVAQLNMADSNNASSAYHPSKYARNTYNSDDDNYNEPKNDNKFDSPKGTLFEFDPNTLNPDGWRRLGVRDKTINTIQNYLSKGGKFRKPDDIKRVYGLFPNEAERLLPYIKIAEKLPENLAKSDKPAPTFTVNTPAYLPKTIDVNMADTTAFIALPGIGSKLAFRIVNFREKLGGFYSIEQVGETYGLPDSTFTKIKPRLAINSVAVKQININTADANTLKQHPYFRWNIANAIVQYRTQHGNYNAVSDIKKIDLIDETLYKKLAAYIAIQ